MTPNKKAQEMNECSTVTKNWIELLNERKQNGRNGKI